MSRNPNWISIEEVLQREEWSLLQVARATICAGAAAPALCSSGYRIESEAIANMLGFNRWRRRP